MTILFYTVALGYGGAERCMSILANEFVKEGHSVSFVQNEETISPSYELDGSISVYSLGGVRFNSLVGCLKPFKRLRELLKQLAPDVIITFFPDTATIASIASAGMGIPIIFSERNDPKNNLQGWKMEFFQRTAVRQSDWLVFQTAQVRSFYAAHSEKSCVILNPCETASFPDAHIGQRKEIVSVGRLEPQKNQALLIEAFASLANEFKDYQLVIYGEGSLRPVLERMIRENELEGRVVLPGTREDVIARISGSSLFVLSSDYEGLPNALIEAMSLGLPCISTDCSPGGARELIVDGENGLIIPCKDPMALAEAIRNLLRNPEACERMGNNAKRIRERTAPGIVSGQWMEVIEKVVRS